MNEKEINVKVGDKVVAHGYKGTVTEVFKGYNVQWDGKDYIKVANSDYTNVTIKFDDSSVGSQYQNGQYGEFTVIA